jgi:hypothetical protein
MSKEMYRFLEDLADVLSKHGVDMESDGIITVFNMDDCYDLDRYVSDSSIEDELRTARVI